VWFDSHCHLHLCEQAPLRQLLSTASEAGVDRVVTIGIDEESSRRARDLAVANDLWFSAGVHPNQADEWKGSSQEIEGLLGHPRCVAVGESGLDFYRVGAPREIQERAFADHIELAKRHDKALVIHTRDSLSAAFDVLRKAGAPERLVFHCWSGAPGDVRDALETGAYVSFAGNVSFPNAGSLREAAKLVPADRLLVETDSPYLSPVPRRGRHNEPANVAFVGAAVAEARDEPIEAIAEATAANAGRLFGV
jgi:TatD DNase family protein